MPKGSWLLMGNFNMSYTLMCERATLDFDLARGAEALRIAEQGKPPRFVKCDGPDGYSGEISHMLEAIRSGKAPKVVTAQGRPQRCRDLRGGGQVGKERAGSCGSPAA